MKPLLLFRRRLARRLADAIGLTALSVPVAATLDCGGDVVVDRERSAAGGGGASASGPVGPGPTSGPGSTSSVTSSVVASSSTGGCTETTTGSNGGGIYQSSFCLDAGPECPGVEQARQMIQDILSAQGCEDVISIDCGPFIGAGGNCCYVATIQQCDVGRPYTVDAVSRTAAPVRRGSDWTVARAPDVLALSPEVRRALADAWTADALLEHASIAAFARFALELLAVGAPASLIEAAHRAAIDEVRHACRAASLASAFSGEAIAPGAFPFDGAVAVSSDLAAIAAATAREGCIGETLATIVAAEQLDRTRDPAVRAALEEVIEDESRHAELAWRTVAWAIERGGASVRAAVEAVFAEAAREPACAPQDVSDPCVEVMAAYGRLDRASTAAAVRRGLDEVVLPCARGLLAAWPGAGRNGSRDAASHVYPMHPAS